MWTILKVFIEFAATLFLALCVGLLMARHEGSQFPDQGSNPHPTTPEGEVPTTGSQVSSQFGNFCLHTLPIRVSTYVTS